MSIADRIKAKKTQSQQARALPNGEPFKTTRDKVRPDPDQSRKEMDMEFVKNELAPDIKERGIKEPLSLKSDPEKGEGYFVINCGETRWTAAGIAGVDEIPYFIDEDMDDFDKFNNNKMRRPLKPFESALFIESQIKKGFKKKQIAERIGEDDFYVSRCHSLIDMPPAGRKLYDDKVVEKLRILSELVKVAKNAPDSFEAFCDYIRDRGGITVKELSVFLKGITNGAIVYEVDNVQESEQQDGEKESLLETKPKKPKVEKDPNTQRLENHITEHIGQVTGLSHSEEKGSGKMTIKYGSLDELDGLLSRMKVPKLD